MPPEQPPAEQVARYWYHPESGAVWTTEDGYDDRLLRPEIEELTAEEYTRATVYYAGLHMEAKQ